MGGRTPKSLARTATTTSHSARSSTRFGQLALGPRQAVGELLLVEQVKVEM